MNQDQLKQSVAKAAIDYIRPHLAQDSIIGVGTGSTADFFIEYLGEIKQLFDGAVASSERTAEGLKKQGIPVYDLNTVTELEFYIDGADETNNRLELVKGGGGALTREKIVASASKCFVCIADQSKMVDLLGSFPLPIEVIPMARSLVARELVKLGGDPVYRENFTTDNGNVILDVFNLNIMVPAKLEEQLNNLTGVVTNGLFALRPADVVLLGTDTGVKTLTRS